jgi:hypothetical protein
MVAAGGRINVTTAALIGPEVRAFGSLDIGGHDLDDFFAYDQSFQGGVFVGGS